MLVSGAVAMGDTIYVLSGRKGHETKLKIEGVTINEIRKEGGTENLYYTVNSNSRVAFKALSTVVQVEVEGETLFNQAETEYSKEDWKAAGEDYKKAIKKPGAKEWIKARSDERMLDVSGRTGDFLGAVAGFVELARKDPVTAAKHKPTIGKDIKKDLLPQAITSVNAGMASSTTDTKLTLYPFLAELYNANGQADKAGEAAAAFDKLQAGAPAGTARDTQDNTNTLAVQAAAAESWLTKAKAAFAAKQYDQALSVITSHKDTFVDDDHRAGALFLIAQVKEAQATKTNTNEAWEDTALAYMRVVAHFKTLPSAPAADALYRTGVIEENLKSVPEALTIYNQVVNEFKGSTAAKDAQAAINRINAANK